MYKEIFLNTQIRIICFNEIQKKEDIEISTA